MKCFLSILFLLTTTFCWSDDFVGWKKISTEHYTFIFEESDKNTAFELADYSEGIYDKITTFFDFYPPKIHVYINSRIDSPNGMFYPIPSAIHLYPVFPLNSENTTKGKSWLYELLLHEMVHYVHLENRKGFFGLLSYPLGKDLAAANGAFLPAWMIEGIAVYLETVETDGGRGTNRYFEAFTKAAAIEEEYFTINQLAYSSDFPPYNRIYSGGYALMKYIMVNYGVDVFQNIYLRYVKFPFFGPFRAIKMETGNSLKTIYEDFKTEEINKYSHRIELLDIYPSVKKSTNSYGNWTHPVKTDKGILLYNKSLDRNSKIVLVDAKDGSETTIIETELMDNSSFNSDAKGEKIVFTSGDYSGFHNYGDSYISNLYLYEGGEAKVLSENNSLFHPAISVDGEKIIAVQRDGSYSKLVTVDPKNGEVTELYAKEQTNIMNPAFSPDSQKIVFVLNDHGYQDIYIMDSYDPDSARPLITIDRDSEYFPRFTNDGIITFISDRDEDLSLYSFDLEKKTIDLLFKDPVGVADGFVDGQSVYYDSYRTKGYEFRIGKLTENIDFSPIESERRPQLKPIGSYEMKKYIDWAFPYVWLPKPYLQDSVSEGLLWGFGALVYGGSYGQSGLWTWDLNYLPGPGQINSSFDYSRKLGISTLNYSFSQSYEEYYSGSQYFWRQGTEQSAAFTVPLFEHSRLNRRNVMQTYLKFKHKLLVDQYQSFTFNDSLSKQGENYLYVGGGLSMNNNKINYPSKALFGDFSLFNQFDFSILLPALSSNKTSYILKQSGSLALPLGQEGFIFKPGWQVAYHNNNLSSSAVSARGWTSALINSDISVYYSLDFLMPITLVDWGMPLGFNIQNLAAALHLEGINNFQWEGSPTNEWFAGFEFIGTYGYNYGETPAGIGVNFRFYNNGYAFDPSEDIKIYLFLSFSSLI